MRERYFIAFEHVSNSQYQTLDTAWGDANQEKF